MPTCQNCGKEWSWGETMKSMMRIRISMECPHCGERQYQSATSRTRSSMIGILPIPLVFIFPYISGMTVWIALILAIILSAVMVSIMPFFLKLASKEEPYW
ncbi:cxxc_20_cxxc protein [Lentibacillus halodurans]|uniref:Cxxc_20_cxxc protein n=1 Tax=Lentibacillus halodurans TaxID=237679 RepID=A0A1I0ZRK1_9BACI|nr:TIGR04104 family putative zinc finger protein [Lentibacillus halodurans]SFB28429.1 cxxc_20_cxxc protein [Lentibacillus halodurans]